MMIVCSRCGELTDRPSRCETCRRYSSLWRQERIALAIAHPELIPHGTREGYNDWDCGKSRGEMECPLSPSCSEVHQEYEKEKKAAYFDTEHGRAKRQARVAKRRGVWHVQYDIQVIFAKYEYQCFYKFPGCESFVRGEYMLTEDHVIPVYYNGPSMAFNILPACRSCNSYKKHRWLTDLPFDVNNRIADPNLLVALAAGPQLWTPKLLVANTSAYNDYLDSLL